MAEKRNQFSQFVTSPPYTPAVLQAAPAQIVLDENGVPWVEGTGRKVIEIVIDSTALGMSPAQIHEAHPDLSLEHIHAALAYYQSHEEALDADIAARAAWANQMRAEATSQLTRAELEARLRERASGTAAR